MRWVMKHFLLWGSVMTRTSCSMCDESWASAKCWNIFFLSKCSKYSVWWVLKLMSPKVWLYKYSSSSNQTQLIHLNMHTQPQIQMFIGALYFFQINTCYLCIYFNFLFHLVLSFFSIFSITIYPLYIILYLHPPPPFTITTLLSRSLSSLFFFAWFLHLLKPHPRAVSLFSIYESVSAP